MTPKAPGSTVLRMVQNSMNILNIEVETGWTIDDIKALAKDEGFYLNPSTSRFLRSTAPIQPPEPDPEPEAAPELTVVEDLPNDEPVAESERVTLVDPAALITAGTDHWDDAVAEAARESKAWLDILAEALVQAEQRTAAMAEVEHYEQLLHAARIRAGLITDEPETPETPAYDAKTVRAWAIDNGIDCPTRGTLPRRVLDAYLDAHEVGAA